MNRLVDVDIVVTSGKRMWCNGYRIGLECQRCGFDSCSRHNISHFHHIHDTGFHDQDPVQAAVWLLNIPCVYVSEMTACMYVIVTIKRLTILRGRV